MTTDDSPDLHGALDAADADDPEAGLSGIAALLSHLAEREEEMVLKARVEGFSWERIAVLLERKKQVVWARHKDHFEQSPGDRALVVEMFRRLGPDWHSEEEVVEGFIKRALRCDPTTARGRLADLVSAELVELRPGSLSAGGWGWPPKGEQHHYRVVWAPFIHLSEMDEHGVVTAILWPPEAARQPGRTVRSLRSATDLEQLRSEWKTNDVRGEGADQLARRPDGLS